MHNEFSAFISDDASTAIVKEWAERQGFPATTVVAGGADLFATMLEGEAPPKFVIVDFDNQTQPVQIAARLVSLCGPAAKIIAVGSANDVGLYRNMLAAGLTDYLVKPLTAEALTQAMILTTRGADKTGNESKEARIVIMVGVRGGIGTSTIAINAGWVMAHELKQKVALLDLDMQFGTSALALDLEPGRGLRDVVSSPQRVDSLMVASAIVSESENFAILSAEEPIDEPVLIDNGAITALMKEMRPNYNVIIIDLPRHLLAAQKRLLSVAHEIILVTEMSLVGIRDTLRLRTVLKSLGCPAHVSMVATRIGPNRPAAVEEAAFNKGTQSKIDFTIPDDHKNVVAASNAGKMLATIAPNTPITKAIQQLAKFMSGAVAEEGTEKKNGKKPLASLFGGKKPAAKEGAKS